MTCCARAKSSSLVGTSRAYGPVAGRSPGLRRKFPGMGSTRGKTVGGARLRTAAAFMSVCALGGVVACTPDPDPPASGELSVLSYNVAGLPQEISTVNPQEHIPLISPLLEDYDVVLTQEDFDWWVPALDTFDFAHYHERLRAQTTHPYASTRWLGPEAAGIDPAV